MSNNLTNTLILPLIVSALAGGAAGYFAAGTQGKLAPGGATEISASDVRTAILSRPEMVEEAFYALQEKRRVEEQATKRAAMGNASDALYGSKLDPVIGPDDAPFVMVEFFDYNCGFCKIASKWLKASLAENPGKIKIVMKDFPILEGRSNGSRLASAAAWAARLQGEEKYAAFHFALMDTRGGFDDKRIDDIASGVGLDVARMRADMNTHKESFEALMNENFALAAQLGIDGTPAFIIGDTFISGANTEKLQSLLDAAIKDAG